MVIEAIRFIMEFYNVSEQDAILYYWDEIESYMSLKLKLDEYND